MLNKIIQLSKNEEQPHGLSIETIQKVSDYFKENFGCALPDGYKNFINQMNGFSYDGHSIFCCYNDEIEKKFPRYTNLDLVTFNTKFVENTDNKEYIILGKSSIDYIGYIKNKNKYVIMTNGDMRHLSEFETFEEMLINFLGLV